MAFYTDTINARPERKNGPAILKTVGTVFARIIAAQNRSVDIERMQNLSDRELADMGLDRAEIVRHVYRDIYYV